MVEGKGIKNTRAQTKHKIWQTQKETFWRDGKLDPRYVGISVWSHTWLWLHILLHEPWKLQNLVLETKQMEETLTSKNSAIQLSKVADAFENPGEK